MSINEQIDSQTELLWRISRAMENLQKLGEAKITHGQVTSRIKALEANWERFQSNHEQMVKLKSAADEKQRAAIEQRSYFAKDFFRQGEENYLTALGDMLDLLESLKPVEAPTALHASTAAMKPASRRLPPIALPTFSGSFSEWKPFHDLFSSLVRENEQLSEVEKLHYLKTSLAEEPAQLIRNIALTEDNFGRAWETLISRYENKRLLISAHLGRLFAIPRVAKKSSTELKRLHSDTREAIGALQALGRPVNRWDDLLVHLTIGKLDPASLEEWEKRVSETREPPTVTELESFLIGRIHTLEAVEQAQGQSAPNKAHASSGKPSSSSTKSHAAQSKELSCAHCKGNHYIAACKSFQGKSLDQRKEFVGSHSLCFNCLGPHAVKDCRSQKRCRVCEGRHHTLLHRKPPAAAAASATDASHEQAATAQPAELASTPAAQVSSHAAQPKASRCSPVLLATAQILVSNPETGECITVRALLDQGSESSFISESLMQRLRATRRHAAIPVIGVGAQQSGLTRGIATLQIRSRVNPSFSCRVEAFILPRVTSFLPSFRILVEKWPHLQGLTLADPNYAEPGQIDVILGADVYGHVLIQGIRKGASGTPIAQETQFGWVLSGPASSEAASFSHSAVQGLQCSLDNHLIDLVRRFWVQEEVPAPIPLTTDEENCEKHFRETVSRDATGRYIVRLPVKDNSTDLGNSRIAAHRMLLRMEKRFVSDPKLKEAYSTFLREYRDLGHMRRVPSEPDSHTRVFYLPHHGVVRESSSTTKLRVVFNGSQKTEAGLSLNDNLYVGPKVQTDLADVLLRWRQYPVAFSSDIAKMYRQILVHQDDWDLQRILWRENTQLPIEEYQLCTVTYGLASAPYLAIRVLHQLAQDEGQRSPRAVSVLMDNTYVDDVLSGADNPVQARAKILELNQLLKAGGFELKKWTSSHPETLADISSCDREIAKQQNLDQSPFFRALGLMWKPEIDSFAFAPQLAKDEQILTKRKILSETAQLFDPLGWLSPITIRAKIFMQQLWTMGLGWDQPLPELLASRWSVFRQELQDVALITIPRWIGLSSESPAVEIHGFADASQEAIAAVIYLRTYLDSHEVRVSLMCSKTKVAPLKKVTIPRLELCAALLLIKLVRQVESTLSLANAPVHLWSDSTVALAWIKGHPSRWKDYVRNRVTEIQDFARARWRHISGFENPADLASRGASPEQVRVSQLWTRGPSWLAKPSVSWPSEPPTLEGDEPLEERKQVAANIATAEPPPIWDLVDRYSSLTKLLRVTALCRRAADAFLAKTVANDPKARISRGPITPLELANARSFWVAKTQHAYFEAETKLITQGSRLTRRCSLFRLAPFVDQTGLLRVGGRLQHSSLAYDEKHPLILPRDSSLTTLVIDHHHRGTLHGGPQLTLATIRQRFWIIGGRLPVRSHIHRCVPCARQRATLSAQQMGQLPKARVSQSRPFLHSGVDYAGPFAIRASRGRNPKHYKGYIVVFVCFSTSAVHLELVSDCTTEAFIAAYKRFTARRGISATITSDCGRNLVGADAELRRLLAASSKESAQIASSLASHGTHWHFNPPSAPHFGGKWEAGVKSVKFHLKRVVGETKLTFEQFETFLAQVEGTLNSRPLCALSDDPTDSSALTPGHFLIGTALNTVPEPSLADVPVQRLSHWQHSRHMLEHFWKRWSVEYLQTFQHLPKWQATNGNVQIGAIVLIRDENLPPSVWPLARVINVHPGSDGLVRVVTVKTKSSVLKRPIVKLCVLPVNRDTESPAVRGAS